MYIEEVCIDGFKSYAKRTVISGFDDQFNAITGLNGSGKSNVLDSICFVLGITNLSHVRVCLCVTTGKMGVRGTTDARATDGANASRDMSASTRARANAMNGASDEYDVLCFLTPSHRFARRVYKNWCTNKAKRASPRRA